MLKNFVIQQKKCSTYDKMVKKWNFCLTCPFPIAYIKQKWSFVRPKMKMSND